MQSTSLRTVFAMATAMAGLTLAVPQAAADAAADFYKGKTLTFVVGFGAGGGTDTFARFYVPQLAKHMPGSPTIIVQNMPGAGGIKALNHFYNIGAQDGTRVMLTSPTHTIAYLLGRKGVRYDMNKIRWIGTLTQDTTSCIASGNSGVRNIQDTRTKELIFGATGKNSSTTQHVLLLKNMFGYKIKIVNGYRGSAGVLHAMEKGEVNASCTFWASKALGPQREDVASGKLVPIIQMGRKPHPAFGNAPVAYDLARNDEERAIMGEVFGTTELSRPFAAAPGTPNMQLEALRQGFWNSVTSPDMKEAVAKTGLIIDPLNWQDTEKALKEILSTPKPMLDKAKKMIGAG